LLGIGSNAANNNTTFGSMGANTIARTTPEELGGVLSVALTTAQMPIHQHMVFALREDGANYKPVSFGSGAANGGTLNTGLAIGITNNAGSGESHLNVQPYITVYFWKRTA